MAEQVVFDIVNRVQMNKVDRHWVVEILKVNTVPQIASVSNAGNDICFMRSYIFVKGRLYICRQFSSENFYRSKK